MKSRYFISKKGGFKDNTAYVEVKPNEAVILRLKDGGKTEYSVWTSKDVLDMVKDGFWKEIFDVKKIPVNKSPRIKAKPKAPFHFVDVGGKWDFRTNIDAPIRIYIQSGQYNYKGDVVRAAKKLCERMGYEYNSF